MEIVPTQAGASKFRQKVLEVIRKMGKKSVNNLYKPMLEHGNVEKKFHTAARGKSNRPDVAAILNPDNIQTHVNVVKRFAVGVLYVTVACKFHVAAP